jgi:hypothetical protein
VDTQASPANSVKQRQELVHGEAHFADDGAERAARNLPMVGYRDAAVRGKAPPQDHVASFLVIELVANAAESPPDLPTG